MKNFTQKIMVAALSIGSVNAMADVWPQTVAGGMKHMEISLNGTQVEVSANLADSPLSLQSFAGESYTNPANVLDGKAYNDQYGWTFGGFTIPDAGEAIWIELESQTAGLETYEGGMRPMKANHTYDAIFGTDGSSTAWRFDRMMTHNWYAATTPGDYEATYKIYVGDELTGSEIPAYTSTNLTLTWTNVPEPTSVLLLAGGAIVVAGRRRTRLESR